MPAMPAARRRHAVPARATAAAAGAPPVVIRDAETETLLRTFATPLFRAAGLDPNLVRIIVIRDDAINSFGSTGNRMFGHGGPYPRRVGGGMNRKNRLGDEPQEIS
jgi:predicted Zn-dependent protease